MNSTKKSSRFRRTKREIELNLSPDQTKSQRLSQEAQKYPQTPSKTKATKANVPNSEQPHKIPDDESCIAPQISKSS